MEMKYCRRCGSKLSNVKAHIYTCAERHVIFANSSPAVAVILVNEHKELLIATRNIEPGKGKLHVPAGFCDNSETFEQAIERELQEELGITTAEYSSPQYLQSHIDPYVYKNETIPVVTAVYWATMNSGASFLAADDLDDAKFVPYDMLDFEKFQFGAIIEGIKYLRSQNII